MILDILFLWSWWLAGQLSWFFLVKNRYIDGFDILMLPVLIFLGYISAAIYFIGLFCFWLADNIEN
jgi:hypothetical protein